MKNLLLKIQSNLPKWTKAITILLCLSLVAFFIWFRFIRHRLPRSIPFQFNEIGLLICSLICYFTIIAIIDIYQEKRRVPFTQLSDYVTQPKTASIFANIINYLFQPFEYTDNRIKHHRLIEPYYGKYLIIFVDFLEKKYPMQNLHFTQLVLRLILAVTLAIDVFYFKELYYIYKLVLLGAIILFIRYLLYSLKEMKRYTIKKVNERSKLWLIMHNEVSQIEDLEKFILIRTKRFFNNESKIEYIVTPRPEYEEVVRKLLNAPSNMGIDNDKFMPKIQNNIFLCICITKVLHYYLFEEIKYKYVRLLINIIYLVCWSYIIIVSLKSSDLDLILKLILKLSSPCAEPISGLNL